MTLEINDIHCGDCLQLMPKIPSGSVDMVLCDLPYGVTARNKWDEVIPFVPLWKEYSRVVKVDGAIVLTASQPFTTLLISSNPALFKYCYVWNKKLAGNFLMAKKRPLAIHEDICVFYKKQPTYNPQMVIRGKPRKKGGPAKRGRSPNFNTENFVDEVHINNEYYPTSILDFTNAARTSKVHPTEKPVTLFDYLIKTFTNPGDLVLDNAAGSGTTGVACQNLDRDFILIEQEPEYCRICCNRLGLPEFWEYDYEEGS